ncbi:MAG: insulinase family protein [Treponema sp.]|nr:insulinase family protein [Treponema sp.]
MKKFFLSLLFLFVVVSFTFAEKTPVKSLYSYKLKNGLSLFVAEDHSVPLTYIEIAVRCGAYTQTPETIGLFHLYEHMMFKGNSLYKNAAELDRATSDMGVSDRNGTTNTEYVNYFFTVPSYLTEKGLEFWNAAIRFPNLDEKEFENEKKVVIAEINGKAGEASYKLYRARMDLLFPEKTYTTDGGGTEEHIKNATVQQLREIMKTYYIPNNAALFVAGDVDPVEVHRMVKRIFGSWEKGKDPFEKGMVRHTKEPFSKVELRVQPFDKITPDLAVVQVFYRGPDSAYDINDTYTADIFCQALSDPQGIFKTSMVQNPLLGIPDTSYIYGGYPTSKTVGLFSFEATLLNPESDIAERAVYFAELIPETMKNIASSLNSDDYERFKLRIEDSRIIENETAFSLVSSLKYFWLVADEKYYYTYEQNLLSVNNEKLSDFAERYFVGKNPIVTVLVNPSVYEKFRKQFERTGFKLLYE